MAGPGMLTDLHSFDGTERASARLARPDRYRHLFDILGGGPVVPRGAGLSYCLASAGEGVCSVSSLAFDRILSFDPASGVVSVESGARLGDLYRFSRPRGWYLPVMPGHPAITVGGCLAADVHGKNQYRDGNFLQCVESLQLYHPDHGELRCSREENPEVFELTVGGFGLTGYVVSARLRLQRIPSPAVRRTAIPVDDLRQALEVLRSHAGTAFSMHSWHDLNGGCFGRGLVSVDQACDLELADGLRWGPLDPESRRRGGAWPLLRPALGWGLAAYGLLARAARPRALGLGRSLFPVLGKEFYFSIFGRGGFREYQVLIPEGAWEGYTRDLERIVRRRRALVTLASLKLFRGRPRYLRFAGDGVCLALDAAEGADTRALFSELDGLTESAGGIVNLAKDGRVDAALARRIFPELEAFREGLRRFDPGRRLDSALRRRLGL